MVWGMALAKCVLINNTWPTDEKLYGMEQSGSVHHQQLARGRRWVALMHRAAFINANEEIFLCRPAHWVANDEEPSRVVWWEGEENGRGRLGAEIHQVIVCLCHGTPFISAGSVIKYRNLRGFPDSRSWSLAPQPLRPSRVPAPIQRPPLNIRPPPSSLQASSPHPRSRSLAFDPIYPNPIRRIPFTKLSSLYFFFEANHFADSKRLRFFPLVNTRRWI